MILSNVGAYSAFIKLIGELFRLRFLLIFDSSIFFKYVEYVRMITVCVYAQQSCSTANGGRMGVLGDSMLCLPPRADD